MLSKQQMVDWDKDGFVVIRGFLDPEVGIQMEAEAIAAIRNDPPSAHQGEPAYILKNGMLVQPEAQVPIGANNPEDFVAKVFNTHLQGIAHDFAVSDRAASLVSSILGDDIDVFQSMFILKNPGAWGQPWHQDSYYFDFDHQPQVGLWLAISEATLDNGCLSVLPGSHTNAVLEHVPDLREGANQGYLEILGVDEGNAIPVLMNPGDLLVFNSFLLHRSVDNRGGARRSAMVYHYGRADSVNLASPEVQAMQQRVTKWIPVRRSSAK
ncbi:MAG: phytanoyl-CoA dioxygenase family protein [Sphingomonadaceae bacterium]|nr:phytanoyl-CoA dioxygenase family protein [Sphingomonadaceae bacterium]